MAESRRSELDGVPQAPQARRSITSDLMDDACYVRALYPFTSTESSSLGFCAGDLIRVLTKLESGWWDGLLRGERGWFPSNYVEEVEIVDSDEEDAMPNEEPPTRVEISSTTTEQQSIERQVKSPETVVKTQVGAADNETAYWIPQTTSEGRVYFFNTVTGISKWDMPFEPMTDTRSEVIRTFTTPLTAGSRVPPPQNESINEDGASQGLDYFTQTNKAHSMVTTLTPGWHEANGDDGLDESTPEAEKENGEILLFAMPDADLNRISHQSAGHQAITARNAAPENFRDSMTFKFDEDAQQADNLRNFLLQWSQRSSSLLDVLKDSIQSGRSEDYRPTCTHLKGVIGEMLQTLGLTRYSLDVEAGAFTQESANSGAPTWWRSQYKQLLDSITKLMLSAHVAGNDWASVEEAQKMLVNASELHSMVLAFVTEAIQNPPPTAQALMLPAVLPASRTAGGWQGNGLVHDRGARSPPVPVQLSTDAVSDLERLAKVVYSGMKICKTKLKQYEKDISTSSGSIILRDAMEVMGHVRQLLNFCEQINLSPLDAPAGSALPRSPTISDFAKSKQSIYDASAAVVMAAQRMTTPRNPQGEQGSTEHAMILSNAFTDMQTALQSAVMTCEFMVQEYDSKYSQFDPNSTATEIILETDSMRSNNKMKKMLGDQAPESPILLSATFSSRSPAPSSFSGLPQETQVPASSQVPWFLENELDADLTYDSKGNVKAGPLLALVERLTRHDLLDSVYNNTFLLTYRSFTTAEELSSLLMQRFTIEAPKGLSPAQVEMWAELKQGPVRLRVFNIFKSWMENFFVEPPNAATRDWLNRLKRFAQTVMSDQILSAPVLVKLVEKRIVQGDVPFRKLVPNTTTQCPPPIVPRSMKKIRLLDLDALEVARQLTLMESNLYNKIKPTECLDKSWSKPDAAEGAENIKAMILHSNQITAWVAEAILYQTDLKKRVNLIKHFVLIAEKCRHLNNFSALTAIISGLNSAPIHRLRRTWDLLNTRVAMSAEDLNRLMNSSKNFSQYREALHQTQPPCVPFLGVYLTDLTFIEDGNPNMSVKARHLINISKRQKTADVIRDIQQYQAVPYSLQPVPEIQTYIRSCMDITRDISELYSISLEREPREREDEKIARLLQESGFL